MHSHAAWIRFEQTHQLTYPAAVLLTPYGYREWMTITVIAAPLAALAIVLLPTVGLGLVAAGAIAVVWLAMVSFFRDPYRRIPRRQNAASADAPVEFLSPADGTISAIEHVDEHDATAGPAIIIRIFLSILNVHVNRAPCDAEVVSLSYTPGTFLNAQTEESARCNECNLIALRIDSGGVSETIGVRQVSGMIARRIVCAIKVGDHVKRGEKFGMIKFGSTTELILPRPQDVTLRVKKGDKVKAGLTTLASMVPLGERLENATTDAQNTEMTLD